MSTPKTPQTIAELESHLNSESDEDLEILPDGTIKRKSRAERTMDRKTFQDRFVAWPVPETACADLCATTQQKGRSGTNFFTYEEAGRMFDYIFGAPKLER